MTDEQSSPNVDAGWRKLRDSLDEEGRRKLYAGELWLSTFDLEHGMTRTQVVPPAWLALEEELDR